MYVIEAKDVPVARACDLADLFIRTNVRSALGRNDFWLDRRLRIGFTSPQRGEVDLRSKSGEGALP
jgi:hypothetical protein